ncbi:hypothetical protein LEN26_012614 [Aphanomyces euteiches]|nr:hypothetical protein LEN26_012614 [Aphanomyces euteiches]
MYRMDHSSRYMITIQLLSFLKEKQSKKGTTIRDPRHCYANPLNPAVCLFVALGIYLACNPQIANGSLFPGSKQRFSKSLSKLAGENHLTNNQSENKTAKKDIGTHSIRKGVATYACSGSTGGPSIVSICLRCGWSLGNVMERYFRYESAGDQFTGRVVAGLPINSGDFTMLPPHFADAEHTTVKNGVRLMFPGLCASPTVCELLKLILASLVHHHKWLLENLPHNHALLSTPLFSNPAMVDELASLLVSG